MLDAITSLAFSMHSNPGVYALLLGSGVSRSANIPTGWDITLELVRKIAAIEGTPDLPVSAAEAWYRDKFGEGPDYAKLLDGLAKTQSERQRVLKDYIEPNDLEREQGHKLPTPAHRAIAKLVAAGRVRVIITTNFDQLLEVALRDEGVVPTVIASCDDAAGAVPLVHSPCTVIKIHGDYMDTRILNTPTELEHYEPAIDTLLDRVLDEFGLIVCGWSADWDVALKRAIASTPARRYSMYWAARGAPSAAAQTLIEHRGMLQIGIAGADEFFMDLQARVAALDEFDAPHPLSTEVALALLRRYLPEDHHEIALDELVRGETERLVRSIDEGGFNFGPDDDGARFRSDVARYEALGETLITLAMEAGRWCRGRQARPWKDAVRTLARRAHQTGGMPDLIALKRWPAACVMYAFGIGALAEDRFAEAGSIISTTAVDDYDADAFAGDRLNAGRLFKEGQAAAAGWDTTVHTDFAVSQRLFATLKRVSRRTLRNDIAFERAFIAFELALAFGYGERRMFKTPPGDAFTFWAPIGLYCDNGPLRRTWIEHWRANPKQLQLAASLRNDPMFDEVERFAASVA